MTGIAGRPARRSVRGRAGRGTSRTTLRVPTGRAPRRARGRTNRGARGRTVRHATGRTVRRATRGTVAAALTAALAAGCGAVDTPTSGGRRPLVVFAAASLTEAFTSIGRGFEAAHPGVRVRFGFGGSSALAQQIDQGAPADVFAAASPAAMKQVTDAGLASAPRTFARNRLEIAVPAGNPGGVRSPRDLANPRLKVVLCAPQVPCGAAAATALEAAGVTVRPVSLEQDVKAALTKVRLKEADAALVYRTDVRAAAGQVHGIDFPEAAQAVNDYPIATLTRAPQAALAREFTRFVLSPQGAVILARAGFESP